MYHLYKQAYDFVSWKLFIDTYSLKRNKSLMDILFDEEIDSDKTWIDFSVSRFNFSLEFS